MDVHASLKKVKNYIECARGELSSIHSEFISSFNVNGCCIEKNNIDKLDSEFQSMIYSLNNKILPLANFNDDKAVSSNSVAPSNTVNNNADKKNGSNSVVPSNSVKNNAYKKNGSNSVVPSNSVKNRAIIPTRRYM